MTIKKFKIFLASNIEKEEKWLTEMSNKGLHLTKYRLMTYYFEEDPNNSYVYQTDFRPEADEDYFQLYRDAGWEYVDDAVNLFHYFRKDNREQGVKKIYSDKESVKESYSRMMRFYITLFLLVLLTQVGLFATWRGLWVQYLSLGIVLPVVILYVFLLFSLRRRVKFYNKKG
ncbi:DUF2812 domain-containing protein [Ornithinibacillus halophilus]|uniref:DUF2812 domain-containing protein n=1 Tax=Ornithinibacillus halophilus TaxID=930117 RepID=A0A1M5DYZ2_9BACI|nr:DUF2812 domain-containing protein [Ornithinibacillus halophilus]SHF72160.1 Protein of unknown function [Ornithinibacillus halophilus]